MKYSAVFLLLIFSNYLKPDLKKIRTINPTQNRAFYNKKIKEIRSYEIKNIERFLKGSFIASPKGGWTYSVRNTSHCVDVVFCEFSVIFKNEAGKVVGTVDGRADNVKAGGQVDPKDINTFSLPPFGKTTYKFIFTKTIIAGI